MDAIVAMLFSFFLTTLYRSEGNYRYLQWASNAVLALSLFTFPVLIIELSNQVPLILWARSIGSLIAAVYLNLLWTPLAESRSIFLRLMPWVTLGLLFSCIFIGYFFPDLLPVSAPGGKYILPFRALNVVDGLGVMVGSLYFYKKAKQDSKSAYLPQNLFLFFFVHGFSRCLLAFSERWDLSWWSIEILRTTSALIALYSILRIFTETLWASIQLNRELADKNKTLETVNETILQQQRAIEEQRAKAFHSARMASIGQLAGTVAHEINNPLAAISLNVEVALNSADKDGTLPSAYRNRLQQIQKISNRIDQIVKSFLRLSREGSAAPMTRTSLAEIVENTLDICQSKFSSAGIDLGVAPVPEIFLRCRSVQISQVLLNLLLNSFDAVENSNHPWVKMQFEMISSLVKIRVTDSGTGIEPSIASRIMEPFFTTKPVNKGTGLGLSISKSLIEEHGGKLYYDAASKNTTFVIEMPTIA